MDRSLFFLSKLWIYLSLGSNYNLKNIFYFNMYNLSSFGSTGLNTVQIVLRVWLFEDASILPTVLVHGCSCSRLNYCDNRNRRHSVCEK